ncbi:hypothetical protein V8C44DRAFT_353424 [Trichoderma aethiopicum]
MACKLPAREGERTAASPYIQERATILVRWQASGEMQASNSPGQFLRSWLCVQGNHVRVSSAKEARPEKQKNSGSLRRLARPLALMSSAIRDGNSSKQGVGGSGRYQIRAKASAPVLEPVLAKSTLWTLMDVRHFHRDLNLDLDKSSHVGAYYTHECR